MRKIPWENRTVYYCPSVKFLGKSYLESVHYINKWIPGSQSSITTIQRESKSCFLGLKLSKYSFMWFFNEYFYMKYALNLYKLFGYRPLGGDFI